MPCRKNLGIAGCSWLGATRLSGKGLLNCQEARDVVISCYWRTWGVWGIRRWGRKQDLALKRLDQRQVHISGSSPQNPWGQGVGKWIGRDGNQEEFGIEEIQVVWSRGCSRNLQSCADLCWGKQFLLTNSCLSMQKVVPCWGTCMALLPFLGPNLDRMGPGQAAPGWCAEQGHCLIAPANASGILLSLFFSLGAFWQGAFRSPTQAAVTQIESLKFRLWPHGNGVGA